MDKLLALVRHNPFIVFIAFFIMFQAAFSFGVNENHRNNYDYSLFLVKNKIVADSASLPFDSLPFSQDKTPKAFLNYIEQLNHQLQQQDAPLFIESIKLTATAPKDTSNQVTNVNTYAVKKKDLIIGFITTRFISQPQYNYFSLWVIISALMMTYFVTRFYGADDTIEEMTDVDTEAKTPSVWLQIDLKEKKLRNTINNAEVYLANKPLCFYCALIDFCVEHPDQFLNPNKDLPDEFLHLTNKYFNRLMDLGHTIRKRPNFSNNVEKTLSEIRAALDEVFHNDIDKKNIFSPPKAIGEGSRSKAHNVSLQALEPNKIVFIGK